MVSRGATCRCVRLRPYFARLLVCPATFFKPLYPIDYEVYVKQSSISHNLDPYLVCAVIKSESNWDPEAESNQGAQGLMQLMPETAQDMIAKGLVDGGEY